MGMGKLSRIVACSLLGLFIFCTGRPVIHSIFRHDPKCYILIFVRGTAMMPTAGQTFVWKTKTILFSRSNFEDTKISNVLFARCCYTNI